MPRYPRDRSGSGIYHAILRGINKQEIFHDEKDKRRYIETLTYYKNIHKYELYGYCLMDNHIHLLIKEGSETISQTIKRIGVSYVYWYNMKYERCGHLFQDRFRSENVEDDKYLLVVLRYIHQNPVKAGIVRDIADYRWSSYPEYINPKGALADIDFVLNMIDPNRSKALRIWKEFMAEDNTDKCLDDEIRKKKQVPDEDIIKLIKELVKSNSIVTFQEMNNNERNKIIKELKDKHASIRQLARITGLGRRIIEKA